MDWIIMEATEIQLQKQYKKGWWHNAKQVVTEASLSVLEIVSHTFQVGYLIMALLKVNLQISSSHWHFYMLLTPLYQPVN
jgi:hypothetical protein